MHEGATHLHAYFLMRNIGFPCNKCFPYALIPVPSYSAHQGALRLVAKAKHANGPICMPFNEQCWAKGMGKPSGHHMLNNPNEAIPISLMRETQCTKNLMSHRPRGSHMNSDDK